ncbi:MAG: 23S rRNA (guanosine(2251)-2'-O)-methyltransferase RlmB [Saprospiraceae bacterium]|nr:23S rRNA (guanosine(2251)-2'-O)-methyltransferase RlmB [Saprospiraceae bacterium]
MAAPKDIIYGKKPVLEALERGQALEKILVANSALRAEFHALAKQHRTPIQVVPPAKLDRITRKNHQGVVAHLGFVDYQRVDAVVAQAYERGEAPLLIALDSITDVGNMGAIARSAWAMGAHALIVPEKGSALINGITVKASAGAIQQINICKVSSLKQSLAELQEQGICLIATTLSDSAKPIQNIDFNQPCCIIMGNEEKGVGSNILAMSNEQAYIPMARNFDSLNVSVATGIMLYEVLRSKAD